MPLAAALALLVDDAHAFAKRWRLSDALMRDIQTLQRLRDSHSLLDLYDAGETIARQLPPMLRALGRDDRIDFPDFAIKPLLTGDEIAVDRRHRSRPARRRVETRAARSELEGITSREPPSTHRTSDLRPSAICDQFVSVTCTSPNVERTFTSDRPVALWKSRHAREDAFVLDVVIAEVGVHLADGHRGGQVADVRRAACGRGLRRRGDRCRCCRMRRRC